MSDIKFQEAIIKFEINGEHFIFEVYHNLQHFGLDIEDAFTNWVYRTQKYTRKSFCNYVMSKDINIECLSKEEFLKKYDD